MKQYQIKRKKGSTESAKEKMLRELKNKGGDPLFKLQGTKKMQDVSLKRKSCQSGGIEVMEKVRAMQHKGLATPISISGLTKYR